MKRIQFLLAKKEEEEEDTGAAAVVLILFRRRRRTAEEEEEEEAATAESPSSSSRTTVDSGCGGGVCPGGGKRTTAPTATEAVPWEAAPFPLLRLLPRRNPLNRPLRPRKTPPPPPLLRRGAERGPIGPQIDEGATRTVPRLTRSKQRVGAPCTPLGDPMGCRPPTTPPISVAPLEPEGEGETSVRRRRAKGQKPRTTESTSSQEGIITGVT